MELKNKDSAFKGMVLLGLIIASSSVQAELYIDDRSGAESDVYQKKYERNYDTNKDKSEMNKSFEKKDKKYNSSVNESSPKYNFEETDYVKQIGQPEEGDIEVLDGFGRDIPLVVALKQIVPEGWGATKRGDVDVDQEVNWKGGEPWTTVLSDLAEEKKFKAVIDWNKEQVALSNDFSSNHKTDKTAKESPTPESLEVENTRKDFSEEEAKEVKNDLNSWVLDPELTLRSNIEAWAKKIGWSVSWGAVDYPVTARTVLNGGFAERGGPLDQISQAYRNSEQPIKIEPYLNNKVVRVTNIKFDAPRHVDKNINGLKERRIDVDGDVIGD